MQPSLKERAVDAVVKRRGCCCNLSVGVALHVRVTTNGMGAKNYTHIYVARTSNNRVISSGNLYCWLLLQCEALRTFARTFRLQQYIHNIHQCNTDDGGQAVDEELRHVQVSGVRRKFSLGVWFRVIWWSFGVRCL